MKKETISQLASIKPVAQNSENSYLVNRINELILLDIEELEVEDLRMLVSQNIALDITLPLAIEILEANPFAEGDYYSGDLLKSVLSVNMNFWNVNLGLKDKMKQIASRSLEKINDQYLTDEIKESLESLIHNFVSV